MVHTDLEIAAEIQSVRALPLARGGWRRCVLPEWLSTTDPDASSPHSIANLGTQHRPRPMVVFESFVCDRL
jgi:hypothetical protein